MKTRFLSTVAFCLVCFFSSAQLNNPQIRMRIGVARSVMSPGKPDANGVYRKYDVKPLAASWIGFEFAKPLKKVKNANWLAGIFFDEQAYAVGINPERFSQFPANSILKSSNSPIRLYAGLEKSISPKHPEEIHNNYFTFFGGLGISYNGKTQSSGWTGKKIGDGITTEGKHFQGAYESGPIHSGYFMQVHARAAYPFTPDVFAGLRWNIRNGKGNNALGAELLVNYSLMTKFYLDIPYTLDGQPSSDRLKDKGINIQFNSIIPLKNFRKKKAA